MTKQASFSQSLIGRVYSQLHSPSTLTAELRLCSQSFTKSYPGQCIQYLQEFEHSQTALLSTLSYLRAALILSLLYSLLIASSHLLVLRRAWWCIFLNWSTLIHRGQPKESNLTAQRSQVNESETALFRHLRGGYLDSVYVSTDPIGLIRPEASLITSWG